MNGSVIVREQRVQSGDVSLAVYSQGDAGKPTVVLVHGYPDSHTVWDRIAMRLAERYHVVTYDVRGAGASDAPPKTADYTLEKLAGDLRAVTDALCSGRKFHLVAHDWGSIQHWESVTGEGAQNSIASYTTISGPCLDHVGHWMRHRLLRPTPGNWAQLFGQLLHSWYIYLFHLPWLMPLLWKHALAKRWPMLLKRIEGVDAESSTTRVKDGYHGIKLYRANIFPRLLFPRRRSTTVPVQVILPLRDNYVRPQLADDLHRWASKLWRRDLNAGHWVLLAAPELIAGHIAGFVNFVETQQEPAVLKRARVTAQRKPYSGKLAIVTGAGSGIGRETLLEFAQRGAEVISADINVEAAERSAMLARLLGAQAHAYSLDVGSTEQMETFAQWVERELGVPDIVVNNAGIGLAGGLLDTSAADWERLLRVNLWSVIDGSRLFAKQMIAAGKPGHIVNTASAAAFAPSRNLPAYATTKAAVLMLSDCLRAEVTGHGIHVAAVCPGFIDTNITTTTRFVGVSAEEETRQQIRSKRLYQRRNLKPDAVARKIVKAID
ncbi:MAG: SDR family oxidoreductase, partial [Nevskiales bacterium]